MTSKTGNFKSFNVFVNMLENAINQVRLIDLIRLQMNFIIKIRKVHQLILIYLLLMILKQFVKNNKLKDHNQLLNSQQNVI